MNRQKAKWQLRWKTQKKWREWVCCEEKTCSTLEGMWENSWSVEEARDLEGQPMVPQKISCLNVKADMVVRSVSEHIA